MPLLIDTHTHLFSRQFATDRKEMTLRAAQVCEALLLPNVDAETIEPMHLLADEFPNLCYPMMGLHPCHVEENYQETLTQMREWLNKRRYVAIGEAGIDLYWDKTTLDRQIAALNVQLGWAKELNLPIVLHCRDAFEPTIACVEAAQDGTLRGVFHCFVGTPAEARRIVDAGFYLGIGGVITYPKSGLAETTSLLPRDRVVLETDSPYLAPVPFRGKRNESAYIQYVAQTVAQAWQVSAEEAAQITTENAKRLFF